jgi:hypothetical protein
VIGLDDPVAVILSGFEVTVKVGELPYTVCPEKETVDSESSPSVAVTVAGATGGGNGQISPARALYTSRMDQTSDADVLVGYDILLSLKSHNG